MKNKQGNGTDFPNLMETEELERLHQRAEELCRNHQKLVESSEQVLRQENGGNEQLFAEASGLMQQMQMLLLEYDFKVKDMEAALETSASEKQALEQQNISLEASNEFYLAELNRTRESLMSYESGLSMVTHSVSWKLTAPLRGVKRWLRRAIGRAARRIFRLAKRLYGKKARLPANWPLPETIIITGLPESMRLSIARMRRPARSIAADWVSTPFLTRMVWWIPIFCIS
jgi:phosphoribosyl-ATP pyrophosphohydrolase